MLNDKELDFLNKFIMSRPLNNLNLFDAQEIIRILQKINNYKEENKSNENT